MSLKVNPVAKTPEYEGGASFSPDGKSVVYAAGKPGDRADHVFVRTIDGKLSEATHSRRRQLFFTRVLSRRFTDRIRTRQEIQSGGLASNWNGEQVSCLRYER